jgi:predicted transcriptional regulator
VNHPEQSIRHSEHGESLKSRMINSGFAKSKQGQVLTIKEEQIAFLRA